MPFMQSNILRYRKYIWLGIILGAFLDLFEASVHALLLHEGSFAQQLLQPDMHEFWMRSTTWAICILAGLVLQYAMNRQQRSIQALRESEEQQRSTISSMDDLLFVLDRNGVFLDYHAPEGAALYLPPEQFLGKSFKELLPPQVVDKIDKAVSSALKNEQRSQAQYTLDIQGETIWYDAYFSPRYDADGRADSVTAVVKDITVQKQAEQVLQTSEQSYRGLFNSVADAIFIQDGEGCFLDVNEGAVQMYGYPRAYFIGKTPVVFAAPDKNDLEAVMRTVVHAFTTGESQRLEFWGKRRNGEIFPVDVRLYKGNYFGQEVLIALASDITERKRTEDALRNSEAMLRATLESTGDGILVVSRDGRILQTNDRFNELWRVPQTILDSRVDQNLLDFAVEQLVDQDAVLDKAKQLYASLQDDYDVLFFKDGRVYERFSSPLILNDEVEGRVWSFNDITDRVQAEEELQRNKLMIDTANASIFWIHRDGSIIDVNDAVCKMLGYSRTELLEMKVFDFDKYYDRDRWTESWAETKSLAKSHVFSEHHCKDGTVIPVEIISNYIEYKGGEYQCCFVTDISRRRRNETVQSVLYEISEATGRVNSLAELLEVIQKQIGRLLDTNNFYISLYDEKTGLYTFPFVRDANALNPEEIPPQELKRSLTDYVRRCGEATLLTSDDIHQLAALGEIDLLGEMARVWMGIPLILSGRVIGIVGIQSYTNENEYTDQDRDLMSIVASSIAMAIDRKRSEESIRQLRLAVESSGEVIFTTDTHGIFTYVNPEFTRLYGFKADEVINKTSPRILRSGMTTQQEYEDLWERLIRRENVRREFTNRSSSGKLLNISTSINPIVDNDGETVGYLAVQQDITLQKKAEAELAAANQMLRNVLDTIPVKVFWKNRDSVYIGCNELFAIDAGFDIIEDVIGKTDFDLKWHDYAAEYQKADRDIIATGIPKLDYIEPIELLDGSPGWAHTNKIPLRDTNDRIVGVLGVYQDITDRVRAETILKESEAKLAEAQRVAKIGSWEYDIKTNMIKASDELFRIFGMEPTQELVPSELFDKTTHPDDIPLINSALEAAAEAGTPIDIVYRLRPSATGEVHVREQAHVVFDENGKPVKIFGTTQDITDRIRAEEAVIFERDVAQRYLNIAGVILLALDADGQITMINPKGSRILGYEPEDLIGRNWFDTCVPFDTRETLRKEFARLLSGIKGDVCCFENPILTARGKRRIIAWNDTLVRDDDGNVIGTLSSGEDITDRKQADEILRQKEANLAEAQRIAKVGSWEYSLEKDAIEASDELHRIYGLDPLKKVTTCGVFSTMTHPDDKQRVDEANRACNDEGKAIDMRYRIIRADGEVRHVYEQAQVKLDQTGCPIHIFGTVQDITEQMKAEEERKALESQLRRTQRLETIGTLAGGIAHDFNNILTPILGYADMAMISVPEDHEVRQDLEHVIKAAHRAKDLVKQILAFSRQGDQEKKPLEIHLIVKEVLELLRASLPSTIEIRQNIYKDCGSVLADPSQIHSVMMNLCTNAFHAMRDSGGILSVSLTLDLDYARTRPGLNEQPFVKLAIGDTGHGMSKETMDRIFEPFFTTKGVGEGTGLGLSVVHGIITNHSGEITVDSAPGKGTTFNIYLPRVEHVASDGAFSTSSAGGGNEHILLVDDEEEITTMTKRMLEKFGYSVTTRNSSVDALKLFSASPREFDMVICDQTMPYLTGSELANEMLVIRPDVPIIMMTGYSESITAKDARRMGIRDYLNKPLIASELNSAIRKQLDHQKRIEV